eukprot:5059_1
MLNFNQMDPLRRNSHLVGGFLYNASHSQTHGNNRYPDYVASEPSSNNHEYQHDLAVSNQGISPPIQQILLNYRAHKPRLLTCVNEGEKYAEIQAKFENERYIIVNINEKECGNDSGMNEAKRGTKRKATTRRSNHNKSRRGNKNSIRIFTTV